MVFRMSRSSVPCGRSSRVSATDVPLMLRQESIDSHVEAQGEELPRLDPSQRCHQHAEQHGQHDAKQGADDAMGYGHDPDQRKRRAKLAALELADLLAAASPKATRRVTLRLGGHDFSPKRHPPTISSLKTSKCKTE